MVPFHELGEIRVRAEVTTQTQGLAQTTDSFMKISKEDTVARITLEDDGLSRIYEMFVPLEYVDVLSFANFSAREPSTGGALDYSLELKTADETHQGLLSSSSQTASSRSVFSSSALKSRRSTLRFLPGCALPGGSIATFGRKPGWKFTSSSPGAAGVSSSLKRDPVLPKQEREAQYGNQGAPGTGKEAQQGRQE